MRVTLSCSKVHSSCEPPTARLETVGVIACGRVSVLPSYKLPACKVSMRAIPAGVNPSMEILAGISRVRRRLMQNSVNVSPLLFSAATTSRYGTLAISGSRVIVGGNDCDYDAVIYGKNAAGSWAITGRIDATVRGLELVGWEPSINRAIPRCSLAICCSRTLPVSA